jgi:hypothetical protein
MLTLLSLCFLSLLFHPQNSFGSAKAGTSIHPTHPRQVRVAISDLSPEEKKKKAFLVEFITRESHWLLVQGKKCDEQIHNKWVGDKKNLFSGDEEDSFSFDDSWHNQVCNFFKFLHCLPNPNVTLEPDSPNVCQCDSNKLELDLQYVDDGSTQSCRSRLGEICNFVKLPLKIFPGMDFEVPESFSCVSSVKNETTSKSKTVVCSEDFLDHMYKGEDVKAQKCVYEQDYKETPDRSESSEVAQLNTVVLCTVLINIVTYNLQRLH